MVTLMGAGMSVVNQALHLSMHGSHRQIPLLSGCGFLVNRLSQSICLGWVRCSQTLHYRGCKPPAIIDIRKMHCDDSILVSSQVNTLTAIKQYMLECHNFIGQHDTYS